MKIFKWLLFLLCMFQAFSYCSEDEAVKRIYSHILIRDYISAICECESALTVYPGSENVKKAFIRTLAENGKDDEAISYWKKWELKQDDPDLLETLAWGVLMKSENSSQYVVNSAALMSAFFTHDVRAVRMLLDQLSSSNAFMRAMAVQLSAQYRDAALIEELKRLLKEEKVWFVRLEVMKALGAMEVKEIKQPLKKILASSRSTAEEKAIAIASLVTIYETIEHKEFLQMVHSKRAGLRHFACEIVSHLDLKEKIPEIEHLLDDPCSDVRIAALNTLSLLGLKELKPEGLKKIQKLMDDSSPTVSITAAWITARFAPEKALESLKEKVYSQDDTSRYLASFALANVGEVGARAAKEALKISPDPFVRVNLALGMIGHGAESKLICDILYSFLMLHRQKVMWDSGGNPLFHVLMPTKVSHIPQVPQYPTMVDQLARLEILNSLAILNYSQAEEALKSFLNHHVLGVTYAASTTLLEEGGEEALDILRKLLKEENENVRVQAALVLALSGGQPDAIQVLQEAYQEVDRDMKVNILGALGHIGDKTSIPFLVDLLEEPYQILKVVAASALIQCVYH